MIIKLFNLKPSITYLIFILGFQRDRSRLKNVAAEPRFGVEEPLENSGVEIDRFSSGRVLTAGPSNRRNFREPSFARNRYRTNSVTEAPRQD